MKCIVLLAVVCFTPSYCFFSYVSQKIYSFWDYEQCNEKYISPDFVQLRSDLREKFFGQEIITDKIVPALEAHFRVEPKKALVICMHGWTGSGKNYLTKIVVDSLYKKKSESQFVRMFNGRLHFPLDIKQYVNQYKVNIQNWVKGNVTNCPRSLFIFDEIDKMPATVIDAIKPFFDYHEKIDSVDFRKSIFVFISNRGAEVINRQYIELWRQGKLREDMQYKDFEPYLRKALYNSTGGLGNSAVLEGHLVSLYLPFLPMEEDQVRLCIHEEFRRQKVEPVTEHLILQVLEEMEFNSDRFSTSGCKRVPDFVAGVRYKLRFGDL